MNELIAPSDPAADYMRLVTRLRDTIATPADQFEALDPDALAETEPIWVPVRVQSRVVGRV